jgi:alkylhydroperoxidase/carboxymuconolactone decarboxylase family protein YurZ
MAPKEDDMVRRSEERGYVLITVAVLLFVILAFAALAVDIGVASSSRTAAQRAADASALAGAFTFVNNPTATQPATAQNHAMQTALSNSILGEAIQSSDVTVAVDVANQRVTVTITHTQGALFAGAVGENTVDTGATAVAEASTTATGDKCTKPWFIPNTVLSTNACTACSNGQVLIDSSGNVTTFAISNRGTQFTIKPGSPSGTIAPGQFYAMRLADSRGGNDYRENIRTCPDEAIYCNQSFNTDSTEPGAMIGPTKQGTCELICYNGSQNCNNCPMDTYVAIGQYRQPAAPDGDGLIHDTSRSLVLAPIINVCGYCPSGFPPGITQLNVIGFAMVFIEGTQGNDVVARLLNVTDCSGGGGGGGGGGGVDPPETGPFSIPVRLVRVPAE